MDCLENLEERVVYPEDNEADRVRNRFKNGSYAIILPDGAVRFYTEEHCYVGAGPLGFYDLEHRKNRKSEICQYEIVEVDPGEKIAWAEKSNWKPRKFV